MSLKYGLDFIPEELSALTIIAQAETLERGLYPSTSDACWHNPLVERLRIVLEQRNIISDK